MSDQGELHLQLYDGYNDLRTTALAHGVLNYADSAYTVENVRLRNSTDEGAPDLADLKYDPTTSRATIRFQGVKEDGTPNGGIVFGLYEPPVDVLTGRAVDPARAVGIARLALGHFERSEATPVATEQTREKPESKLAFPEGLGLTEEDAGMVEAICAGWRSRERASNSIREVLADLPLQAPPIEEHVARTAGAAVFWEQGLEFKAFYRELNQELEGSGRPGFTLAAEAYAHLLPALDKEVVAKIMRYVEVTVAASAAFWGREVTDIQPEVIKDYLRGLQDGDGMVMTSELLQEQPNLLAPVLRYGREQRGENQEKHVLEYAGAAALAWKLLKKQDEVNRLNGRLAES